MRKRLLLLLLASTLAFSTAILTGCGDDSESSKDEKDSKDDDDKASKKGDKSKKPDDDSSKNQKSDEDNKASAGEETTSNSGSIDFETAYFEYEAEWYLDDYIDYMTSDGFNGYSIISGNNIKLTLSFDFEEFFGGKRGDESFEKEMEDIVATADRQFGSEAETILEDARRKASDMGFEIDGQLSIDFYLTYPDGEIVWVGSYTN